MRGRQRRAAATLAVCALLAACGFHLQGAMRLPPAFAATYLESADRYTDLHRALGEALTLAGAGLVQDRQAAGATVELLSEDSGQRVLSVSAQNTPTEYEVYYTVRYRVRVAGREVLTPQTLTLTRDYSFNETALLAKERERDNLRGALARQLAALILRRLAALPP